jgi:hypothetical protein
VTSSDFIYFDVNDPVTGNKAICMEDADFYVNGYIANAGGNSEQVSGSWNKYSFIGGSWSAADTTGYNNWFGKAACGQVDDWFPDWGLGGGDIQIAIDPGSGCCTNDLGQPGGEHFDGSGTSDSCGIGHNAVITILVGPDRASTCGF